jgi:hypothetical protein
MSRLLEQKSNPRIISTMQDDFLMPIKHPKLGLVYIYWKDFKEQLNS